MNAHLLTGLYIKIIIIAIIITIYQLGIKLIMVPKKSRAVLLISYYYLGYDYLDLEGKGMCRLLMYQAKIGI